MEQLADVVTVVPDLERLTNQIPDTAGGPGVVDMSMCQRTLPKEGPKLSMLIWGQSRGWTEGNRRLQRAVALQTGFPAVDGMDGDAEMFCNLSVRMDALLQPIQSCEAPFFELSAREVGGKPARHPSTIAVLSYAEINRVCLTELI